MNDTDKEALSALMDNEGDTFSLRRLLSSSDAETVRDTWQSYHVTQQVMQKNGSEQFLHVDISKRVSAALNSDAVLEGNDLNKASLNSAEHKIPATTAGKQHWIRATVAASVAVAVVIGAGGLGGFSMDSPKANVGSDFSASQTNTQITSPLSQLAESVQSSGGMLHTVSATTGERAIEGNTIKEATTETLTPSVDTTSLDSRYNRYLLQHVEQKSLNGQQGMMNFARMGEYQDF